MENKKIIITSGYFNPLHVGHLNLLKESKQLGDFLVVIVNNDEQVKVKGAMPFMAAEERVAIINDLRYVDAVFLSIDKGLSIEESLKAVAQQYQGELFFAKGGDRNASNIPAEETAVCDKFHITIVNGVGGQKMQSSSWLLNSIKQSNGK